MYDSMRIDNLDFFIIEKIYMNRSITTWDIAKVYCADNTISARELYRRVNKQNFLIKQRLKKFQKWGLVLISKYKEKPEHKKEFNKYNLLKECVKIGSHKFPDGYHRAFLLKINCKWHCFEF